MLYGAFVFVQTVRHRDYFLPVEGGDEEAHEPPPRHARPHQRRAAARRARRGRGPREGLTPTLEAGVDRLGAPKAVVGIVIAALVLLPEGLAALRAARANRLQTSMNLALGSALATIGLTIPAVAVVSIAIGQPLELGLGAKERCCSR